VATFAVLLVVLAAALTVASEYSGAGGFVKNWAICAVHSLR